MIGRTNASIQPLTVADPLFAGGEAEWKGSIKATIEALPKFLPTDTTITLPAGYTETANLVITGFFGATLAINAPEGATIYGNVSVANCASNILLQGSSATAYLSILPTNDATLAVDDTSMVEIRFCTCVALSYVHIHGKPRTSLSTAGTYGSFGVNIIGSCAKLHCCKIGKCYEAIRAYDASTVYLNYCIGETSAATTVANNGNVYSVYARGSFVGASGSVPTATTLFTNAATSSTIAKASTLAGAV